MTKLEALKIHLKLTTDELLQVNQEGDSFEYKGFSYLILTNEEANEFVKENVKANLWAFDASFICSHAANNVSNRTMDGLRLAQRELGQGANVLIEAIVRDMDTFAYYATLEHGRALLLDASDETKLGIYFIYPKRIDLEESA